MTRLNWLSPMLSEPSETLHKNIFGPRLEARPTVFDFSQPSHQLLLLTNSKGTRNLLHYELS